MPIKLGNVGHLALAVRDPRKSGRWWVDKLGLHKQFEFDGGVAVGNDAVTLALFKGTPRPEALEHVSFHLPSMAALRAALAELKRKRVELEDPGDEIGPEGEGSKNLGLWFHDLDGYRWELSVLARSPRRRRKKKR